RIETGGFFSKPRPFTDPSIGLVTEEEQIQRLILFGKQLLFSSTVMVLKSGNCAFRISAENPMILLKER
ncbi:MAG TPA: hypothetical protein VF336_00385, partial [Syntrophales bacterium]